MRTPVSAVNTFQDLPRLRETADNTERAKSLIISFQCNIETVYFFYSNPVCVYRRTPLTAGNTFQGLPRLHGTADNTERYI